MSQFNEKDIVRVAINYYEDGLTQAQIAKNLNVSRSLVSKLLIEARNRGIVEIYIKSNATYTVNLERELEKKYNLKSATIIDSKDLNEGEIEKKIALAASNKLVKLIQNINNIGISWGKSIKQMVDVLPYLNFPNTTVYPLIGGMGEEYVELHSNQLSYNLANKLHGKTKYLYTPALMSNLQSKEALLNNPTISNVIENAKNVELAIVGISNPYDPNSTMKQIGYINDTHIAEFKEMQVIGDINSNFFDVNGDIVDHEINKTVIGISLNDLKKIEEIFLIGFGDSKENVIRTALEQSLVNHIVTTDKIANNLLSIE